MGTPLSPPIPPLSEGGVTLDLEAARRTERAVKYIERLNRGGGPTQRMKVPNGFTPSYICKTTSTISAMSGTTLGTGSAQICSVNSSDVLTANGETLTVKSLFTSIIANNVYIKVDWSSERWVIDIAPCA